MLVKRKRMKGIYLLPNLFTTGALFSGFYAIIAAILLQEVSYCAADKAATNYCYSHINLLSSVDC